MARLRSPEKRTAILEAAVHEIALAGLGAPTSKIAKRAGVAEGTLFTYFANKEQLLNQLYVELKVELYARLNADFPHDASLERRAHHVWTSFLAWAVEFPEKRKVSIQLNLCDLVSQATRDSTMEYRGAIDATFAELTSHGALSDLPPGFAATVMSAMQEAAMDFIARQPNQREQLIEQTFKLFWRAVK